MRESFRERREHLHRGMRMPGLTTMFMMLVILGLIFFQLRNPANWRMFGGGDDDAKQVASEPAAVRTAATNPNSANESDKSSAATSEPSGPTDENPEEMKTILPLLTLITDGSTEPLKFDQPAYFQILSWVDHQSAKKLQKRADRPVLYDSFVKQPDSVRLQIVDVKLSVRQIVPVMGKPKDGKPQPLRTRDGKEVYEVRGVSLESGSNFYFGAVTELPPGTKIGTLINEDARLVGYFFKVQGYISQQQQLDFEASRTKKVVPLKAPLIIGRLIWLSPQETVTASNKTPVWVLATVGGVAIILTVGWVVWSSRRKRPSLVPRITTTSPIDPEAPSLDGWLDEAQSGGAQSGGVQSGRFSVEPIPETAIYSEGPAFDLSGFGDRFGGNILGGTGDSKFGESKFDESNFGGRAKNGYNSNEGKQFKNGSSGSASNGTGSNDSGPNGTGSDGHEPEARENDNPNN
jgi:hypothetical protein